MWRIDRALYAGAAHYIFRNRHSITLREPLKTRISMITIFLWFSIFDPGKKHAYGFGGIVYRGTFAVRPLNLPCIPCKINKIMHLGGSFNE